MSEETISMSGHTIMLVQFSKNEESRTYIDSKSPYETFETLCRLYENYLVQKKEALVNPEDNNDEGKVVEYQLEDLLKFVDQLHDLSLMTYNQKASGYTSHGKQWIKGMLHVYLRKVAAANE